MPLQIIHRDITTMDCDAIVNPTDNCFSGSGGTDYAIHTAAGLGLRYECDSLEPLSFGEVAATGGYKLPCKYIIHTMGPVWTGGQRCESVLLRSCYMNALFKASELGAKSIAFPLISSGTFGFPKDKVLRIAIDAISDYIKSSDKEIDVTVCVHDREAFVLSKEIAISDYGKGQFIFTSHNLRPLEVLSKDRIVFTTTNPDNRYYRLKYIGSTNNLRDVYLSEIQSGHQDEQMYKASKNYKIIRAFLKAGDING